MAPRAIGLHALSPSALRPYSSYCSGPGDWPIFTQRKALPFAQPIRVAGCFQPQALALEDGPLVLAGQSVDAELDQHCVAAGVLLEEGFFPLFLTPTVAASGSLDSAYRETSYCAEGFPFGSVKNTLWWIDCSKSTRLKRGDLCRPGTQTHKFSRVRRTTAVTISCSS